VLLALEEPWSAALTIPHDRVRVSFAVPWEGMLLLGTTDTLYDGDPGEVEATPEDVDQIFAEASVALGDGVLRREAVRSTFAGLRVLPGTSGATVSARRETVFLPGPKGMLTIAGGKLTTYRRIALGALATLKSELGLHRLDRHPAPLPGAADPHDAAQRIAHAHPELDPRVRLHLAHLYGALAEEVLAAAAEDPGLMRPVHPEAPEIGAQIAYAWAREWACTDDDVMRRRTTLGLRGLTPAAARLSA
jgi:glycerol-3-phosphate dehydrogenase